MSIDLSSASDLASVASFIMASISIIWRPKPKPPERPTVIIFGGVSPRPPRELTDWHHRQ